MIIYEKDGRWYAEPSDGLWLTDWEGTFSKQVCAPKQEDLSIFVECTDVQKGKWEDENLPPHPEPEPEHEPIES